MPIRSSMPVGGILLMLILSRVERRLYSVIPTWRHTLFGVPAPYQFMLQHPDFRTLICLVCRLRALAVLLVKLFSGWIDRGVGLVWW